ncbi:hypothetical protein [Bradyrhizobium sp. WSM3983]|uniref:hypothetical protein n=1 Tax=Bradyrhizobium sp. WSM3983 TaxID=1038867 RepID=UPI0004838F59|nr:hypothetical protein [Bradyrhizobium sp. WSM3983]
MSRETLINPPRLINVDQRVKYGAVQALTGMAETALADLEQLASQMIGESNDSTRDLVNHHRALMLAWSIVDQADLLRHLIASEGNKIDLPEKTQFLAAASDVQKVRNWMRHIPQRIDAFKAMKEPMPPILGALSFATVVRASIDLKAGACVDDRHVLEYHAVILINTALERSVQLKGAPMPFRQFRIPVDHFVLQAFGVLLPLGDIVALMSKFCDALAAGVDRWLDEQRAEMSASATDVSEMFDPQFGPGHIYRMIAKRD